MKKTIKVNFARRFSKTDRKYIVGILEKRYDVIISDKPDYLFCTVTSQQFLKFDGIRIFFTGECYTPNFNQCDYAIGFDRLEFGDRYARIPLYAIFQYQRFFDSLNDQRPFTKEELKAKTGFCNFVVSNCFAHETRSVFFDLLSHYKKVDSGGRYKNNVGGAIKDKFEFQKKFKFSIAFENCSYAGYCTEKIVEAFAARTIPIYYGDPDVVKDFNPKAFVNAHDYGSLEEVVERVKEIDANDELYLQIINEPIISPTNQIVDLASYLYYIFDQPLDKAKRRPSDSLTVRSHDNMIKRHLYFDENIYYYFQRAIQIWEKLKRKALW